MYHQDLTIESVLTFETKTDLAVVASGRGSARLTMRTIAQKMPTYEVKFRQDSLRSGYSFDADGLADAIVLYNKYAAKL